MGALDVEVSTFEQSSVFGAYSILSGGMRDDVRREPSDTPAGTSAYEDSAGVNLIFTAG
jgi:hypothetical protein